MSTDDIPRMPRRNRTVDDPKKIGFWKIGRTIGKGSSGRVRIARHSKTGQYAAVKIVSKTALNSRMTLQDLGDQADRILLSIEREIVIMKLIDHPNIMRLYDVWETSTELYLILEYVEGGELFDHLCNKGRLSTSEALGYFQQIIAAVDYCHRFNIAHRDLKPENLLLDHNKNIKVADFGMAAWQANTANNGMLQTACGSPHYAAPEVVEGHPYNGSSSDTWSCGIILYALLVGRLPFDDDDLHALLEKVKRGEFSMPSHIDSLAQDLIWKMLQIDVSKRITIPEVLKHPFYTSQKPKTSNHVMPSLGDIARPGRVSTIDPDIFANLRTLWHGTPEDEIIESLRNDEQTWQKGVYHLLVEYRTKCLENYDEEEEAELEHRSSRRNKKTVAPKPSQGMRRTTSKATNLGCSPSSVPPRVAPPTPRRASRQVSSSTYTLDGSNCDTPSPEFRVALQSPSPPTSPLSPVWEALNLPPLQVPELQDDKIQQFFHQIVDHLNAMQQRTMLSPGVGDLALLTGEAYARTGNGGTAIPKAHTMAPPPTPVDMEYGQGFFHGHPGGQSSHPPKTDSFGLGISSHGTGTKPLSVRRPARPTHDISAVGSADKENGIGNKSGFGDNEFTMIDKTGNVVKSSLRQNDGKKRAALGDRHVQIVEPTEIERSKLRKKRTDQASPSSPSSSLIPKRRTWFNTIFKFTPSIYELLSLHDAHTSRNECRRLLMELGARVILTRAEGLGVLECRLPEVRDPAGVMAVVKAVSFRVEVVACGGIGDGEREEGLGKGYVVALRFVQEKGAMSSFKNVYGRVRREWELDVLGTPGSTTMSSPAVTIGGRFEEVYGA